MPSGHAQLTAFGLTFAYLLTGARLYESLALFGLTILQRHIYQNHTILQLFVGSLVGELSAYVIYEVLKVVEKKIKGKWV